MRCRGRSFTSSVPQPHCRNAMAERTTIQCVASRMRG
jgi:hypothetical protein